MALIRNGLVLGIGTTRVLGCNTTYGITRSRQENAGALNNWLAGEGVKISPAGVTVSEQLGVPSGYGHPGAWVLPMKAGGLVSRSLIAGDSSLAAAMAMGINLLADLDGSGDITAASLSLVVSMLAAITGAGSLSADLDAVLNMAASLVASGDLDGAMTQIGHFTAALSGTGSLVAAGTGTQSLEADITATGDVLTLTAIAAAVWTAAVSAYSGNVGSFAEAIANGSAGLTQQQIRDAMTLDTSEPVEAGSIDEMNLKALALIKAVLGNVV